MEPLILQAPLLNQLHKGQLMPAKTFRKMKVKSTNSDLLSESQPWKLTTNTAVRLYLRQVGAIDASSASYTTCSQKQCSYPRGKARAIPCAQHTFLNARREN